MKRVRFWMLMVASVVILSSLPSAGFAQQGYGHVSGQFVLEGEIPNLAPPKITKDANVCATNPPLPDNTLIVDPKTKGIANIVVYVDKVAAIHPKLKRPKADTVDFDQKDCRFKPHVLTVRAGQTVMVKSDDPIQHNTHTYPFRNEGKNILIGKNDRKGKPIECPLPEAFPIPVKCDLHPHMTAYWVILDHPYMAVTDKEGKFKIENLPAANYNFTVWHEKSGYIEKKTFPVAIFADDTDDKGKISVPVAKFKLN